MVFRYVLVATLSLFVIELNALNDICKNANGTVDKLPVRKKNILFLVADDMRPNLGVYGNVNKRFFRAPYMRTPNLDKLARKSMLFNNAFCQQALCVPSRTSFLTGRRPDTTRVVGWTYWRQSGGNFTTIPQFFKENGYRTIAGGKLFHLNVPNIRDDRKFSWTEGNHHSYRRHDPFHNVWKAFTPPELSKVPLEDTLEATYIINKLKQVAKDKTKPFFVAFGARKPHMPFNFPSKYIHYYPSNKVGLPYNYYTPSNMPNIAWNDPPIFHYKGCKPKTKFWNWKRKYRLRLGKVKEVRRAYYAAISFVDNEMGRVLNALRTLGLEKNTIVVFLSDHGWQLGEHAQWAKQTNFDIANRVPLMIRVPGVTDKGVRTNMLTELVDIFPTLVEAAGFERLKTCPANSKWRKLCTEGSSLFPHLRGTAKGIFRESTNSNNTIETKSAENTKWKSADEKNDAKWKDAVFWQYPKGHKKYGIVPRSMGYTIRTWRFRYTEWVYIRHLGGKLYRPYWNRPRDRPELYDLSRDPQENINR